MLMINIRHNWPVQAHQSVSHPKGNMEYIMLHFYDSAWISFHGQDIHAGPGAFIVFAPMTPFSYISDTPYKMDWGHIIGNVADVMRMYGLAPNTLYQPTNQEEITGILEALEFEFYVHHDWWYRYVDIKLEELFIALCSNLSYINSPTVGVELYHRLHSLRQEMQAYPERDWSVKNLAGRIGISESRVYSLYKSVFGTSPNRSLIQMRIEKAKLLLEQGYSVSDTAEKTGYSNVFHFIRQFQKQMGITPGKYSMRDTGYPV